MVETPHVALLDASVGETPVQRNVDRELDARVTTFAVSEGVLPPDPSSDAWVFDGAVISGSQTAVYDGDPWMVALADWVREAHAVGLPMLGICWGHQFLAHALGGRVEPMGDYELGYRTVHRVDVVEGADPVFAGVPAQFVAFETHSDEVTALPSGARLLAENDVGIQAFRHGSAVGVQFHPEYDLETARMVTERKRSALPDERVDRVLAATTPERAAEARTATRVFGNFLDGMARTSLQA